jgi:serine/threonine protein kinase
MTSLIGQSLGRYHILAQLGEGGMAVVYKAYDTRLETDVAVKVIRTENLAPSVLERALKRFEREAKALARLRHPNIVKVTDYGEHEGAPYLVMEYLPGGTLKQRLQGKPMAWKEAVQLLLPIAEALDYAHSRNMIHRDVKPSNILLTERGQPVLTDFGVAKILDLEETQDLTSTGMGVGTPEYMAPEQWVGQPSPLSDEYALGVVLYEMVTGRKPYTADTPAAILLKQAHEPLPRPAEFVPEVPEGVEKILLKALAKDQENRYKDMASFGAALQAVSIRKGETAPELVSASPGEEETLDTMEQGTSTEGVSARPTVAQMSSSTATKTPNPKVPIAPGNAAQVEQLACWGEGIGSVFSVAFSLDGQTLASGLNDNTIGLWRVSDGTLLRKLKGHEGWIESVAFSPDGQTLASGSDDCTIRLWRLSGVILICTLIGHTFEVNSVAFSPDGQTLASGSRDDTICIWRVSDGALLHTLKGHTYGVRSIAFSPDGQMLASGLNNHTIRLRRVSDGALLRTLEGHDSWVRSVVFSPDGQTLASGSSDWTIRLWRVSDGALLRTLEGHTYQVNSVAFSPDGQTLASGSDDKTIRMWRVSDGTLLRTLEGHTGGVESVAFSPDGRTLASGSWDGTIRLWGVKP